MKNEHEAIFERVKLAILFTLLAQAILFSVNCYLDGKETINRLLEQEKTLESYEPSRHYKRTDDDTSRRLSSHERIKRKETHHVI